MGQVFSDFNIIDILLGVEGCPIHWLMFSSIPGFYPLGDSCKPHLIMPVKVSPDIVTHLGIKSSLAENQWSVIIQVRDDGDLSHGSGRGSGNKWSDSGSIWRIELATFADNRLCGI